MTNNLHDFQKSCCAPFYGFGKTVITVGNFDGMHLGHMRLITVLTRRAAELGARSLVYTFHDHPKNVFSGGGSVKLLTDMEAKRSLLSRTAVDGLYFERFDNDFASLSPQAFIERIFVSAFGVRLAVVGSDFRFGRAGSGDVAALRYYGKKYGFAVEEVRPAMACEAALASESASEAACDGEAACDEEATCGGDSAYEGEAAYGSGAAAPAGGRIIGSTAIRGAVASGRLAAAASMLGRLFSLKCRMDLYARPGGSQGYVEAVAYPDTRMAAPGCGAYIAAARIAGAMHRGFAIVAGNGQSADGQRPITFCFPDCGGDLHGNEIEIFFYRKISSRAGGGRGGPCGPELQRCAAAAKRYFGAHG